MDEPITVESLIALEANLDDLVASIRLFRELVRKSPKYKGDFRNHELFRSARSKHRRVSRQCRELLTRKHEQKRGGAK